MTSSSGGGEDEVATGKKANLDVSRVANGYLVRQPHVCFSGVRE
jgi:hypothetical protein